MAGAASVIVAGGSAILLKNMFNAEASQFSGGETGWDDASDAFRHAYVSARFSQYFGTDAPNILGLINEAIYQSSDPRDSAMDILNNKIGSDIGNKYGWSDTDAAQKIADDVQRALGEGRLITNFETDPRVNYGSLRDGVGQIDPKANTYYSQARGWVRRDPLALDLDNDGIETIGIGGATTVLFDYDGDGIRTGTGWVKADDALLAWDKNGNGRIDNGGELFGVDTVLANGKKASDGFAALRDLDSNSDGVFSAADAHFAEVRVWRDLNQDGVSQAGELKSLAETGITAINLQTQLGRMR